MGWHFRAQSIGLRVRFVLPNIRRPVSCHNARSQRSVLLTERTRHNIAARAPTAPRDAIYDVIAASRKHVFALIFLRSRSAFAVAVFGRESVWECLTPVWCVQKQSTARALSVYNYSYTYGTSFTSNGTMFALGTVVIAPQWNHCEQCHSDAPKDQAQHKSGGGALCGHTKARQLNGWRVSS